MSRNAVSRARGALLAVVTILAATPIFARAQVGALPVTGTVDGGAILRSASLAVSNITVDPNTHQLIATGTLTGVVTTATGQTTRFVQQFTAPLQVSGTCPVLDLDIGAIHLDLLGLVVDLAPIHLDITAQSGPGNLLGNLLCALVGLLNP